MTTFCLEDLPTYLHDRVSVAESGCWLWTGSITGYGYGRTIRYNKGRVSNEAAHRAVWKVLVGALESDLELHHECHVRPCVYPGHLRPMSKSDHASHHTSEFCKRGHPLADAYNYLRNGRIWRMCRECQKARQRRYNKARSVRGAEA